MALHAAQRCVRAVYRLRSTPASWCRRSATRCSTSSRPNPNGFARSTGIGQVRAGRITDAWAERKAVRESMVFLHSHGVATARAVRVFKTCGSDAVEVITKNPCRLTRDIRGIGFRIADAIAMKLGITRTAMTRVRAGIGYALTEAMDDGHCGLPADELGPLAARLLDVPDDAVRTALELELAEDAVVADTVADTPCVFLGGLYQAERAIAERLVDLVAGKRPGRTSTSSGR